MFVLFLTAMPNNIIDIFDVFNIKFLLNTTIFINVTGGGGGGGGGVCIDGSRYCRFLAGRCSNVIVKMKCKKTCKQC